MAKTGTSSLQLTLNANRELLTRAGVVYPEPLFSKWNHGYLMCLLRPESAPREFRAADGPPPEELQRSGRQFWDDIERQVRGSNADTLILSSEYFFYLDEQRVAVLRDLVHALFEDIQVVAYVRHPAPYYVSSMQQRVNASSVIVAPSRFHIPLRKHLDRYLDSFDGNVAVRPFEPSALHQGSVVQDFMHHFVPGGDDLAPRMTVSHANVSMSAEAMCIMQRLRRHGWPEDDDVFAPESDLVVSQLNAMRTRTPQTAPRLKPGIEALLTDKYQPDLAWLEQRFEVVFGDTRSEPVSSGDERGWTSQDLMDILDVDRESVDRTLFRLVKELAT
jgi:hypothetical protein